MGFSGGIVLICGVYRMIWIDAVNRAAFTAELCIKRGSSWEHDGICNDRVFFEPSNCMAQKCCNEKHGWQKTSQKVPG